MAYSIKHLFTSLKSDGGDSTVVQPSDWNDDHELLMVAGTVLGRFSDVPDGPAQELLIAQTAAGDTALTGALGYFLGAVGTTAQRPGSPLAGMDRWNTSLLKGERYDGSAWQQYAMESWVSAQIIAGLASLLPTGLSLLWNGSTAPTSFVLESGRTIGSATSGATERANADTENLFKFLWDNSTNSELPVSGGRGANAAADWAANKTITLPDSRDRVIIGKANMGGTDAARITLFDTTVLNKTGGTESHNHTGLTTPSGVKGVGISSGETAAPGNQPLGIYTDYNIPPAIVKSVIIKL